MCTQALFSARTLDLFPRGLLDEGSSPERASLILEGCVLRAVALDKVEGVEVHLLAPALDEEIVDDVLEASGSERRSPSLLMSPRSTRDFTFRRRFFLSTPRKEAISFRSVIWSERTSSKTSFSFLFRPGLSLRWG